MAEDPSGRTRRREPLPDIELPEYVAYDSPRARARRARHERATRSHKTLPIWAWLVVVALVGAGGFLGGLEHGGVMLGAIVEELRAPAPDAEADGTPGPDGNRSDAAGTSVPGEGSGGASAAAGNAGVPAQIDYVQGDGQEGPAGEALPEHFGVLITDASRRPVEGVEVRFEVLAGGGIAIPGLARTDSLGRASAIWQLGPAPGFHRLAATSPDVESIVTFTAIAQSQNGALEPVPPASGPDLPAPATSQPAQPSTEQIFAPMETAPSPASSPVNAAVSVSPRNFVVGGSTVCVLSGSAVTCRGANDRGQRLAEAVPGTRALAAGLFHVCALDGSGVASCWGANDLGQLGDGTRTDRGSPTPVVTDLRFSMLSAGVGHTCGLTGSGQVACWGVNLSGQLGDGSRDDRATPGLVDGPPFEALAAGWNHTCALTSAGAVYCWGLNRNGQLGDGSRLDRLSPRQITTGASALAAGNSHTCAIAGREVLCWGDNGFGQVGDGTNEARVAPTSVVDLPGVPVALVAGASHTCALLGDGTVHCWGQNTHGQLGNGSTGNSSRPTPVAGGIAFDRISAGGAVTCGITDRGVEYCWGLNQSGQLGDGTLTNRAAPTRVRG